MKRLYSSISLLLLLLAFGGAKAQNNLKFETAQGQGLTIESSTPTKLCLHYGISELNIANVDNGEVQGQEIILKGHFAPNKEGYPNLPVESRFIALPKGATVHVNIKENASTIVSNIDLLPAAPVQTNTAVGLPRLVKDMSIYGTNADFPSENAVLSAPTQIRNLDVVVLSVTPFCYNPVKQELKVIHDMDIEICFEGGDGQFGDSRFISPLWRDIFQNLVINADMLAKDQYYDYLNEAIRQEREGCEYLIITPDDAGFLAWADTLKAFRTKQGILTDVVTVSECGGNYPNLIRSYILNAYENWAIPPSAVLLLGGFNPSSGFGIRPYIYTTIDDDYSPRDYPTDNPLADMNGDSLPDLALSRITARNAEECRIMVEKTIQYETNPPTAERYYDHPIIISGHENNKWFMMTSQSLYGFLRDNKGLHPTDLYMMYGWGATSDTIWSTGYNADVVLDYFGPNGLNYIPGSMSGLHEWGSDSDPQPVINALNKESFLTFYRDHSTHNTWLSSDFSSSNVMETQNVFPTFVLSIGCSTTLFNNSSPSLIDAFCTKEHGGAVGGIGAASLTYSYYNDILTYGIIDCIWPDFMPDNGGIKPPDFIRPAFTLTAAKAYLTQYTFLPNYWPDKVRSTMNLFGYIGETYLNLYTEKPRDIQITAGLYHLEGQQEYTVTAENGTTVCLSHNDEILGVVFSEGQPLTFSIPAFAEGDHFLVTAIKQNCFRFHQEVTVISNTGSFVIIDNNGIQVENDLHSLTFGEDNAISVTLHNYGHDAAENLDVALSCESPYVEILQGTIHCQHIDPQQNLALSNAFLIHVSADAPDQADVPLVLTLDVGDYHWEDVFHLRVSAPKLWVMPDFSIHAIDHSGSEHVLDEGLSEIRIRYGNTGHRPTNPVHVQFEMFAPFINVENGNLLEESFEADSFVDQSFRVDVSHTDLEGAWIKTRLALDDGRQQIVIDTLLQFGGIYEGFESGDFNAFNWQNTGNMPWTIATDESDTGTFSAKSGQIGHSEQSDLILIAEIYDDIGISFYKKVSSELNYDKLYFYIDNIEQGCWSGEVFWSQETFPVSRGTHTFMWSYKKDYSVNNGDDCAWIDDISLPPLHSTIVYAGGNIIACKSGSVNLNKSYAYNYQTLQWTSNGDGVFDNSNNVNPVYYPGEQDIVNGGVSLTLTADEISSSLELALSDEINLGDHIFGDSEINLDENIISHFYVEDQVGVSFIWELEPEDAGHIFANGNEVDILWNVNSFYPEAMLTVRAENGCETAPLSLPLSFDLLSIDESAKTAFEIFPNPTREMVNLVLEKDINGKVSIELYNLLGQLMMSKSISGCTKGQSITINLQQFDPGLYLIRISTEEGCWSRKVSLR